MNYDEKDITVYDEVHYCTEPVEIQDDCDVILCTDPSVSAYLKRKEMASRLNNISLIAAACAMIVTPMRNNYYGSSASLCGMNHVDYQYGEHPELQARVSIKKGYHLKGVQERRKALHKRFERKTKHAKGKIPIYA